MNWQEIRGTWVLVPSNPIGIIHFLGGAFVATLPHLTYRWLLEHLADKGYLIIATPFVNTLDHIAIAKSVLLKFEYTLERLQDSGEIRKLYLPIYGIGHSMGCKLHLLIGSMFSVQRAGNILISFNNFAANEAIPLVEQLNSQLDIEFTPTPTQTHRIIQESYQIRRNLLIKFNKDTLDQSATLTTILQQLFSDMVTTQTLSGTHTTPLGQDIKWQPGSSFSPFDALGQWLKQEVYRDLNQLKQVILFWLNPLSY
ncbi:DUF1350 family protein [Aphanizomenon flos-aquae NRERC-008]|jgi:hypothetical protein|uniref:DUF1350 domain-containing protein n=3 Tax=Aphanizomenon flos-aquae TaxID=1176 RepID=A0A1B7X6H9_APHFL|nr:MULTISPECIES: DUF1350 family protein [Aphanizomenon]MBO1045449.1 DUF1350 family protein [Aphanizomenon flos-aquae UKL13-PB]MBO1061122.1 DUF1350 family protein [Aphanizomenon flos-aquae CP01]OBQ25980.1 MAG: hypothetical protein AN481_07510 [Aphanizomenon flos-aquae LD13]OBQ30049.1 MAG: hypothetical protein AN483_07340 [Aphanizomenon flos-aquae MDT14a]OBQ44954.1 MAG: hypothetical protein AN484_04225 [Aphanizomenon flos-aquae WA102]HCQ23174.1 hypothetical protein [Anabaena sp. UBA12330]